MKIKCKHWKDCGIKNGGCCSIDKYERPSHGVCLLSCDVNTSKPTKKESLKLLKLKKSKGLGDTVKKIIDKATRGKVKPCGGCKKRQEALNRLMPYKNKD